MPTRRQASPRPTWSASSSAGPGIGSALVERVLDQLDDLYMVDVVCDAPLEPFYERLGFLTLDRAMGLRRRDRIR